ncbi:UNC93-like protein MFSD11 [Arctopsyche grandis]|uniref:UNC93-like protein MFSD11 n=1 Tax=Arctopsyche grandis TaxID=121162 RepID=UPI00406DA272
MAMERRFLNVILLGFGFMFVFTAFQTMGNIEKTILDSITEDYPSFEGDGYTSLAIIYAALAICNWLAPSIISVVGPRVAMVIGAVTYCLFIITFLFPKTWLLYAASCMLGAGAAIIWTGQGNYLTLNSDAATISRNSGVFWAMLQTSMFLGNLFVYIQFQGKSHIDENTRHLVFGVLIALAIVGIGFLVTLRRTETPVCPTEIVGDCEKVEIKSEPQGPLEALRGAVKLFCTKEMLILSLTFFYTGVELSFFSGVYSSSIGFTNSIGANAKQLVGLSGVFIGIGEVLGGALFGILGNKTARWGRDPIVITGYLIHVLSFFLIFLNLPNDAPFGETDEKSYMEPSAYVAMLCSFLLGFGDACYNTQIYSTLGGTFAHDSTSAFAIFKFTQSVAAAGCFFYSSHANLSIQLLVLVTLATLGTVAFCFVEWLAKQKRIKEASTTICGEEIIPSHNNYKYDSKPRDNLHEND